MKSHIEFLGLPGTGKTTLARELCGCLNRSNHKALSAEQAVYVALQRSARFYDLRYPLKYCSYERGKRWLYEAYRQPRFSYDALNRFLAGHGKMAEALRSIQQHPESVQDCAALLKWLVRLYGGYQLAKEQLHHDEILVLDEGFCNRALSIFGYGSGAIDPGRLEEYSMAVPAPDAVICVGALPETCEKRLADRGYPARLKKFSKAQRREAYRRFEACVSMVAAGIESCGIPVFYINNDGPLENVCQRAGGMLTNILNTANNPDL